MEKAKFVACSGDAHSNPHIDNCPDCAPRYGRVPVCPECGTRLAEAQSRRNRSRPKIGICPTHGRFETGRGEITEVTDKYAKFGDAPTDHCAACVDQDAPFPRNCGK